MAYSDKVLEHFKNPKNVGSLDKNDANVGTGLVGAPECGDVMRLQIKVNPQTNTIEDANSKPLVVAQRLLLHHLLQNGWRKNIDKALRIDNMDIVEELALPQ